MFSQEVRGPMGLEVVTEQVWGAGIWIRTCHPPSYPTLSERVKPRS